MALVEELKSVSLAVADWTVAGSVRRVTRNCPPIDGRIFGKGCLSQSNRAIQARDSSTQSRGSGARISPGLVKSSNRNRFSRRATVR